MTTTTTMTSCRGANPWHRAPPVRTVRTCVRMCVCARARVCVRLCVAHNGDPFAGPFEREGAGDCSPVGGAAPLQLTVSPRPKVSSPVGQGRDRQRFVTSWLPPIRLPLLCSLMPAVVLCLAAPARLHVPLLLRCSPRPALPGARTC